MAKNPSKSAKKGGANLSVVPKDGENPSEAAENPKGVAGDNLTEDQRRALFHNHLKHLKPLLEAKDKAVSELRNFYKLAKAEGTSKADLDTALQLEGQKGEATVKDAIEDQIRIARWLGCSVGYQVEMFPDRRPAEDKAFDDGKVAGLTGLALKPPFDPGKLFDRFVEGWHEGQAALAMKLAPPPPPQDAAPPAAAVTPKPPTPPKPSMAGGLEDEVRDGPAPSHTEADADDQPD